MVVNLGRGRPCIRQRVNDEIESEAGLRNNGEPKNFHSDDAHRAVYSTAACIYRRRPEGVFFPSNEADLAWILGRAGEKGGSITMRGAGSGLAGQSVGEGTIVDCTPGFRSVLSFSHEEKKVVVQPGLVLSELNRFLAPRDLRFPTDPSSQDFCTIGGMLANNSKGPRGVKHGSTLENVLSLKALLADGETVVLEKGARSPSDYGHPGLRRAAELIEENRETIMSRWPRCNANSSGYNLRDCLGEGEGVDLLPLFIGSEGTLGLFLEATLSLMEEPKSRAMALLLFPDVFSAGRAVGKILPLGPSACEILDETFLEIIRDGAGSFPIPIDDAARTILIVESDGMEREEVETTMDLMVAAASEAGSIGSVRASSASDRQRIWAFRKAASPLLNRGRGRLKSTRFIEDGSVPTVAIPDYLRGITAILSARKMKTVVFGHAGAGNFHVNPFVDLKDPRHFKQVPYIARETAELIARLGGCLTGEHGDGRLRTPYLPVVYGGEITALFRKIKLVLDPQELLNPGIIAPAEAEAIDSGLRFSPSYRRVSLPGRLSESSWAMEIERCHGCGSCRDFCPTASAAGEDLFSSRGRANILQLMLAGAIDPEGAAKEYGALFESCLGCSQCAEHCPTGVDIAPLAGAFREAFALPDATDRFLAALPSLGYKTGAKAGRLAGRVASSTVGAFLGKALLGLRAAGDPPLMAKSFAFDPGKLYSYPGGGGPKALLFYGCYGNTYAPGEGAEAAAAILERLGVEVVVPPQACCGISKLTRGMADSVASDAAYNRRTFLPWLEEGYTLVAAEPSCLLALVREQPKFFPSREGEILAESSTGFFTFVRPLLEKNVSMLKVVKARVVYQKPCHAEALGSWKDEVEVLRMIPGLDLLDVTQECCGMAGSFGLRVKNVELSETIAEPLMKRIQNSAPEFVATPCGSCAMQVSGHLPYPVHTPLHFLAQSLL